MRDFIDFAKETFLPVFILAVLLFSLVVIPTIFVTEHAVFRSSTEWNQKIQSKKYWNSVTGIGLIIPDGWEDVEIIEISGGG